MRASDRRQVRDELLAVIRGVRRRWRLRRLLGGLAATGAVGLGAGLLAVFALDRLAATSPAAGWVRAAAGAAIALAAAWYLVRPLLRRVPDERVALYLEEHEPSLEAAVLSALESGGEPRADAVSDALLLRTLETAVRRCHQTGDGRWIERGGLIRGTAALAGVVILGGLLGFFPGTGGRAARLFSAAPAMGAASADAAIVVLPGDATVSRGADAAVGARLRGFEADLVELAIRAEGDTAFDRLPMARAADGGFGYLLFDLDARTEYYVEAAGLRSPTFTLDVAELPYTRQLDLELVFPAYTGLPSRAIPDGGDVAALRGTQVRVVVTPTIPVTGGGIVVDGAPPLPLEPDSAGTLTGAFTIRADGFYHITLDGPDGAPVEASPRYVVDAMSDGPPIVSVTDPGRDERATSIDEVYVEARGEDDYGVADLTLHWSVNGGDERTETLYGGGGGLAEVSAGRTFYLEEYGLQPGDLVSYYATASDNDAVDGRKRATSDIYFIQIRPFERNYTANEQAPPPGGQPSEAPDGDLSERQRQIIAATFNLVRDSAAMGPGDTREHLNTLALAQERLRAQVETLADRMIARQVTQDTAFRRIAEILPRAAAAMDTATARLRAWAPGDALSPEQRALQHLQHAEAVFRDVQVGLGQQGGGGGGATPNAEDLADLFELELDKLRDQYETVDRGGTPQDSTMAAVDETMERLEELARRQQREAERRRREALTGQGTGGGDAQREIAEQVEEEARRLERLSRERSRPELGEAARRLRETAESMRRSAAGAGGEERAVEGLREARRMLERERGEGLRRQAESAGERAEEMAREQERIERATERMLETAPGAERQEQGRRLEERKEAQLSELDGLQRELRDLAGQAGAEQPEAARRLRDAATAIDETQLREKIEYSRRIAGGGAADGRLEESIGEDLDELRDRLRGIGAEFRPGEGQEEAEMLDRARDLARGLESLRERTRELREQEPGEPGQRGEPGAPSAGGRNGGGGLGSGAVRQYQAEARERLEDARELRDQLEERGLSPEELDGLVRGLEEMTRAGPYGDTEELVRLQAALADQAKRVELLVRVRLAGEESAALFLTGDGAVPPEYRELVEAYYRSLSRDDGG